MGNEANLTANKAASQGKTAKAAKTSTRKDTPPTTAVIAGVEDLSGTQIGVFRLNNRIAIGGAGTIYRAQSSGYPFPLAVKVMHRENVKKTKEVAAFKHEFKIGELLKPPYFLRYVQLGKIENRPYIAMELFTGRPISTLWRDEVGITYFRRKLRETWVSVSRAIEALHRAGVVHLDVKPDNFLLDTETGQLKLIDFSLSEKVGSWVRRLLQVGRRPLAGTPSYMSPDQIKKSAPAPAMDLYALGVMLFEYFAGRPPFTGESQNAVMNQALQVAPPPLSRFNKNVSKDLEKFIGNLLSKNPDDRGTAAQASSTLQRIKFFADDE